ncbi:hypothetical protein PsYK624_043610 [Phanerochaete sordida]|uniref:Uncharacterized protein n=1 Tax=Phanerochaete sordida TaxID=48140 RepID=A0A9P3G390_9APHY|nr:hypothetical protein PsYK624_043610 [Phanerochaete sordida]
MAEPEYHVVMEDMDVPYNTRKGAILVPQAVYTVPHRLEAFEPPLPIRFGPDGVTVDRAHAGDLDELPDADAGITDIEIGQRIAIRINWPGYSGWCKHLTIPSSLGRCTKGRLAMEIARYITLFLNDMRQATPSEDTRRSGWEITNCGPEDMVLLEIRKVSRGSWQPVLCRIIDR